MKLFNAIAVATVIGASFIASSPVKAFWGQKEPSHDQVVSNSYKMSRSIQKRIYEGEGWIHGSFSGGSWNQLRKIKLVDCKTNKCTYYTKIVDDSDLEIWLSQVDCSNGKTRKREIFWGSWMSWGNPIFEEGKQAYKKFCN